MSDPVERWTVYEQAGDQVVGADGQVAGRALAREDAEAHARRLNIVEWLGDKLQELRDDFDEGSYEWQRTLGPLSALEEALDDAYNALLSLYSGPRADVIPLRG